jgi:hypothetical protein
MASLERARDVFELRMWADLPLIPAARWSAESAAAVLWLGRKVPDGYLARELRRTAGQGSWAINWSAMTDCWRR